MRTRSQTKRQKQSPGTLAEVSQDGIDKLLRLGNPSRTGENGLKGNNKKGVSTSSALDLDAGICGKDAAKNTNLDGELVGETCGRNLLKEGSDDSGWEDGSIPVSDDVENTARHQINGFTIEFNESPDSAKQKPVRRATAEDKEVAQLVHKVHLLCLLARGRLIDRTCNDPIIQAALLSLLPSHLIKILGVTEFTVNALAPLVTWFHTNFRVRSASSGEIPFHSALAAALETREGTPEEVAALSVALFRALNLTARFVSIMDVASLKPELDKSGPLNSEVRLERKDIFDSSTLMVTGSHQEGAHSARTSLLVEKNIQATSLVGASKIDLHNSSEKTNVEDAIPSNWSEVSDSSASETRNEEAKQSGRKGDLEFELQLEMALSATAVAIPKRNLNSNSNYSSSSPSNVSTPLKRMKKLRAEESMSSQGMSVAVGSRKVGAPLYWAEVYCSGENMTGKWVHVDAVNAIVDGEQKVEAAAAACKKSLRYVVAFAGNGAKDVTRRYCSKWYRISSKRVNSLWWDAVLAPLKKLESGATGGIVNLDQRILSWPNICQEVQHREHEHPAEACVRGTSALLESLGSDTSRDHIQKIEAGTSMKNSAIATRSSLEDMELETKALTEPLPSNQLAYRNHQLYAIEKWLTKYQILHPRGPVLGFCSGYPVYPRSCVQTLHTKERWLREGLQVRADELPAKVVKSSLKQHKGQVGLEEDSTEGGSGGTIALYGKWQTESLCLPHAVDGIVPKNERGQVDVWSEKCLPLGTVHLKLPRLVPVAKRLGIDFAPAMVGFEFRNGRSMPVYEGIVVCAEFKDAILEAYAEVEERREEEEKWRAERRALCLWYQLLSSIVIRKRLDDSYGHGLSAQMVIDTPKSDDASSSQVGSGQDMKNSMPLLGNVQETESPGLILSENHEHIFLKEDECFDEESSIRTKICRCGFFIQVEEL